MVAIAQSVERLVVVQEVAGSSPVSHPNWVRFERLVKGILLAEVRAWPIFFIRAAKIASAAGMSVAIIPRG